MIDNKLPQTLAAYFQEYEFYQIDSAMHADLIIERVLAYGDRTELRWLFQRYGYSIVTEWVRRVGAQRLSWRRYNLWCVLLRLPRARRLRAEGALIWRH